MKYDSLTVLMCYKGHVSVCKQVTPVTMVKCCHDHTDHEPVLTDTLDGQEMPVIV